MDQMSGEKKQCVFYFRHEEHIYFDELQFLWFSMNTPTRHFFIAYVTNMIRCLMSRAEY